MTSTETWKLSVRHHTGFSYDGEATSSYNEARMTPESSSHQHVLDAQIFVRPNPVLSVYRDYFGSVVTVFDLQEPHGVLEVEATANLETEAPAPLPVPLDRVALRERNLVDQWCEYLTPTPRTTLSASIIEAATDDLNALDLHELVDVISDRVRGAISYVTGSTSVHSTAAESWERGAGVCQDITHATVALLRGLDVPARYVSGYLYPGAQQEIGQVVAGQSHAWVEYFCGQWVGIDPTNGSAIDQRHVIVARGRDYSDVAPLKGIYHGPSSTALGVRVEMVRQA